MRMRNAALLLALALTYGTAPAAAQATEAAPTPQDGAAAPEAAGPEAAGPEAAVPDAAAPDAGASEAAPAAEPPAAPGDTTAAPPASADAAPPAVAAAPPPVMEPEHGKPATAATSTANAAGLEGLDPADARDFADARRGFIATLPEPVIKAEDGRVVWDMRPHAAQAEGVPAPASVNPSLWRQAQLNAIHGLFEVAPRIYQVRGFDISNITFIEGDTGYVVIDPLLSAETARAARDLLFEKRGAKPITAVIFTHSHADHYGGIWGVITREEAAGGIPVVAPEGFLEHAVSENVLAGNAMGRRAAYMYGALLPPDIRGHVDTGLGKGVSTGRVGLAVPTRLISQTGESVTLDGIEFQFQMAQNTEAPSEFNIYLPGSRALLMAETTTATLHNLYTLRGALVRDALAWSDSVDEAIMLYGDKSDVMLRSHHWPVWGKDALVGLMAKQRDAYRYIHDQTLRLANQGLGPDEIAEQVRLPDALAREWYNRGYYGTVSHNVKAVFQRYLGWFDGNPANLNPLPRSETAKRYVALMGGADAVLAKAREAYDAGDYRWVAELVNKVVFAEPDNKAARDLQADALEQLGYQAESGPWRDFYLTGAMELRDGIPERVGANSGSADVLQAMPVDMVFDLMAVRLNGPKAADTRLMLNWEFRDPAKTYLMVLENGVLHHWPERQQDGADATIRLSRATFDKVLTGQAKMPELLANGDVAIDGDPAKVAALFGLLDTFDRRFPIVTP
ncbi:alkyl/aryl-sulfatase [Zavarzinia sp. CC-PAN008]|uniref:alkyl/aryl-sulfatase n=1 Tax=Zavarzinia sp. CC-PAN008 TaxID=3243332 RepID=UPI003F74AB58